MVQVAGAFIAIVAFSIAAGVPRNYLLRCGFIGAVGWLSYLLSMERHGVILANFLSAMVIALISHTFARIFKVPVTLFLIPGILTLVPGAGMYRTVYYFFMGDRGAATDYLLQTIEIAGMIALAVFIMDSIFSVINVNKWNIQKGKGKKG